MKTTLALLLLISLACRSYALTCLTCAAATEAECNKQSSTTCPSGSDACATITATGSVLKMCTDRAYCNKGSTSSSASTVKCCYYNNCNVSPSSGTSGGFSGSSLILLITALLFGGAFTQL